MQLHQKRQSSFNDNNESEKTPQSPNSDTTNDANSPQAAPPPKKRMTLDAPAVPVAKEKQPLEAVNEEPMDVLIQDLAKTVENCNQLKNKMERIQNHGTRNFVISDELTEKIKEVCEKTSVLNALVPDGLKIQPIRKRIQLILKNCRELFTQDYFCVESSIELFGFEWILVASMKEKGFLALYLYAEPLDDYENYRIEIDRRFSIMNTITGKDLIAEGIGRVYTWDDMGWGRPKMAKLEDLLDPRKTFLTPEGDIETWVDFTIKSSTLDHLI